MENGQGAQTYRTVLGLRLGLAALATVQLAVAPTPEDVPTVHYWATGVALALATASTGLAFRPRPGWLRVTVLVLDTVAWALVSVTVTSPDDLLPVGVGLTAALAVGFRHAWWAAGLAAAPQLVAHLVVSAPDPGWAYRRFLVVPTLCLLAVAASASAHALAARQVRSMLAAYAVLRRTAVLDERARVARELHDSVSKTLYGIALAADGLREWIRRDTTVAGQRAAALCHVAAQAVGQLRDVMAGLRGDADPGDLGTLVRAQAEEWSEQHGIDVGLRLSDVSVSLAARHEVLAILREALDNVARHAHARQVEITLYRDGGEIVLSVHDDGRGIAGWKELRSPQRYGLIGMSERARLIGGRLVVGASPEGGTRLVLRVPEEEERTQVIEVIA